MSNELTIPGGPLPPDVIREELQQLQEAAERFRKESVRPNTLAVYTRIWRRFERWCGERGYPSLPATTDTIAAYITAAASKGVPHANGKPGKTLNARSLWVHLSAIVFVHVKSGEPNPLDRFPQDLLDGMMNASATTPKKKRWISHRQVNAAASTFPNNRKGLRDRAILLVAFLSGGRRRSEVASMRREDLRREVGGYVWTMPKTKIHTEPFVVGIPELDVEPELCPARTLDAWIKAAGITEGPVFGSVDRHGRVRFRRGPDGTSWLGIQPSTVAEIVKAAAVRLGLDPKDFGAHSLRSGFATTMAQKKMPVEEIMTAGGWESLKTVMGYIRVGRLLDADNPMRAAMENP